MQTLQLLAPCLIGDVWHEKGAIVDIHDDQRANHLREIKHAVSAVRLASPAPIHPEAERAIAPQPKERAVARK